MRERLLGGSKEASNFKFKISDFKLKSKEEVRRDLGTNVHLPCNGRTSERACAGEAAQAVARCAVFDSQRFRAELGICRAYGAKTGCGTGP
jgi:hypothetical protein